MVTHCDVDFLAGQSTETRGKAGCAAVDLLFVTRILFEATVGVCEGSSFLFFLDFRGEDMILQQTAVNRRVTLQMEAIRNPMSQSQKLSTRPLELRVILGFCIFWSHFLDNQSYAREPLQIMILSLSTRPEFRQ